MTLYWQTSFLKLAEKIVNVLFELVIGWSVYVLEG